MKRIAKPNTDITAHVKAKEVEVPPVADISVQRLLDDSLLALYREVKNILTLSARGKLEANDAKDLRDHTKLLFELKEREKDRLDSTTDEELKEALIDMVKEMSDEEITQLLESRQQWILSQKSNEQN